MRPGLRLGAILLHRQQGREIAKISRPGHPTVSNRTRTRDRVSELTCIAGCEDSYLALAARAHEGEAAQDIFERVTNLVPLLGDAQSESGYGTIRVLWWSPVRGFALRFRCKARSDGGPRAPTRP
jgi:hypothetical protein